MKSYELNLKKILEYLLQTTEFVTLNTLSEQVGLSKRSIQNYIAKLDSWFEENALANTSVERKRGYGIRLDTTPEERKKLQRLLNFQSLNIHSGDAKRRLDILKQLMFSEDETTIQGLMSQFYASRATILSDLDWVSQWLAQYKLRIFKTQHRGIGIVGDEVAHRNAIAGYFDTLGHGTISYFETPQPLRRIDEKNLSNLTEVYPRDTVLKIARIIEDAEREFDFILLDDFYTSLLTHMVISVLRISNGNYVSSEFLPPDESYPPLETKTAEYIAQRIKRVLHISLPPAEQSYICIHLIGYNAFRVEQDWGLPFPQKVEHLAISLIEAVDQALRTRYSNDKMLFFGLCLHLKTALYRLKVTSYAPRRRSSLLSEDWSRLYEAIKSAQGLYEHICSVSADEEELLAVSYFFLLSRRRNTAYVPALLISNLGIVPRMELIRDIEQGLPKIKIIDSCSAQQLSDWPEQRFSLIISTEPLSNCSRPHIDLSSLPKKDYLAAIDSYLRKEILFLQEDDSC
ncbi:MAG: PRD domain-containing protein [Clostridiales bacterium]|nr:PRD domain-containing protein [Clostridiales bacterium]MDY4182278.1 PRD domain-containing protein [Pseudoflavonifractor sp.]